MYSPKVILKIIFHFGNKLQFYPKVVVLNLEISGCELLIGDELKNRASEGKLPHNYPDLDIRTVKVSPFVKAGQGI